MFKVASICGARPQFVKMPLLSGQIRKFAREIVIHTGQHYDLNMSDVFFKDLKLPEADYNLAVGSATQGKQTAKMLERIEQVLLKEKPDLVIIFGDTNSTVAGALAAAKLHIPVAHVEAGMRSYNRAMPEEINRIVSDHISDLLFCPTQSSVKILAGEGIVKGVYWTGDVMADLQMRVQSKKYKVKSILNKLSLKPKEYVLATIHRQENTDIRENLENIICAFSEIDETIIFPVHPRTKKYLKKYGLDKAIAQTPHIRLIEPVGFLDMLALENHAKLILTDSGGVQKEAYVARIPCITLRHETEWTETVKLGWNVLTGTEIKKIVRLAKSASWRTAPKNHPNIFGDGKSYLKIARIIKKFLKKS